MSANNNDGSIVIDTGLDNTGFDKGADKLLSAVKDLIQSIEILGDNMMEAFGKITPVLQTVANSVEGIHQKMSGAATQTAQANEQVIDTQQRVAQAAQDTATAVQNEGEAATAFANAVDASKSSAAEMNKQVDSLSSGLKTASAESAKTASSYDRALAKIQKQIDSQKQKLAEYFSELRRIKASTNETLQHAESREQVEHVLEMEQIEVQKLNEKYASQIKVLQDLEAEFARLAKAKAEAQAAGGAAGGGSGGVPAPPTDTVSKWQIFGQAIKTAASHALKLGANLAKIAFHAAAKGVSALVAGLKKFASHSNSASIQANALVKSIFSLKNMLISRIKRTFISTFFNEAKEGLRLIAVYSNSFNQAMSNITNASARVSANISASLAGLIEVVEPIITKLLNAFSKAITYVSAFFGILTGKNTMIVAKKQNDSYRESVAGVTKQANAAGNSLGSAASQASNYGNSLSSAANQAGSYSNSARQAEKRTDSYTGSAEDAADAVKELNREVHSFDELNKRSDKDDSALDDLLDKYDPSKLPSYNDINPYDGTDVNPYNPFGNLDPQAVQDAFDTFEEVPIDTVLPEKLSNLFNELKKLWDEGDFFGFGKLLGEGFSALLQKIDDWINNVFRPKGVEWAKNFAEILNGLVAGVDWKLLGKTIADGLNAIIDIINTFFDKFDFVALGKGLGQAIRSWFDNVDWEGVAHFFTNKWNALIDTIHGIVTTPGIWKSIGSSIGTFVTTIFTDINFPKLGETIAAGFDGIMTAMKFAAMKFEKRAPEISDNLSTGINNMVKGVNWADAAQNFGRFILSILDTMLETVKKTDWVAVGRAIGEFLGNIPWGKILGDVVAIIWEVASGLIAGLFDTGSGKIVMAIGAGILTVKGLFNAAAMAGTVATWVNAIGQAFPAALPAITTFASGVSSALGGIIPAASAMVSGLGTALAPIASVIFSPTGLIIMAIIAAVALIIANWDKIKAAATQLADWVSQTWDKIKTATTEKLAAVKESASKKAAEIRDSVVTAWKNLSDSAQQKWTEVKNAVTSKFSEIGPVVEIAAETIKTNLKNSWDAVKRDAQTMWGTIHTTIKTEFEKIKTPIDTTLRNTKQSLSQNWTTIKNDTQRAWAGIKDTITRPLQEIPRVVQQAGNTVKQAFQQIWNGVTTVSQNAWRTILSGLSSMWSSVQSGLSQMFSFVSSGLSRLLSQAQNGISNAWNAAKSMAGNLVGGLANGISNGWNGLKNAVSGLGSRVISGFNNFFGIHSPSTVMAEIGRYLDLGLAEGVDKYKRNVLSSVSGMSKDVTKEVNANDAAFRIGAESNGLVSNLTNVTTHLSRIAGIFSEINKTLSGMGGIIAPAISTGSVVPYATRVSPAQKTTVADFSGLSDGIDSSERMYDMVSLLRRILEVLEGNGKLDKDELASALAFAMRGESRGFGV